MATLGWWTPDPPLDSGHPCIVDPRSNLVIKFVMEIVIKVVIQTLNQIHFTTGSTLTSDSLSLCTCMHRNTIVHTYMREMRTLVFRYTLTLCMTHMCEMRCAWKDQNAPCIPPGRAGVGSLLGHPGVFLGASWSILEHLGAPWAHLGNILVHTRSVQ